MHKYLQSVPRDAGDVNGATGGGSRRRTRRFLFPVAFGMLVWLGLYLRDRALRSLLPIRS